MKTKIIIFSIFLFVGTNRIYAQEKQVNTHEKKYKQAFGLGAGFTTGVGFSYRYFPKRYGVQLNIAPYYWNYGKESFVSSGLTLLLSLEENRTNNIYAYFGNHFLYSRSDQSYYYDNQYNPTPKIVTTRKLNTGVGIGIEFDAEKRVTLNMMVGYASYNTFESLFFTGELALYYRFN